MTENKTNNNINEEIYNGLDTLIKNPELIRQLKCDIINSPLSYWHDYADCICKELLF